MTTNLAFVIFLRVPTDPDEIGPPVSVNPYHVVSIQARADEESCWLKLPHGGSILVQGSRHDVQVQLEEAANGVRFP